MTHVLLTTGYGDIHIEADQAGAPVSAGAFVRYVQEGRYDGGRFERTVRPDNDHGEPTIEVVQAGIAQPTGSAQPLAHESTADTGIRHTAGTVSLPRAALGTATGTGFFICLDDAPALDAGGSRQADGAGFAAFGRVVAGMDVVRRIHRAPTVPDAPVDYLRDQLLAEPVIILTARELPS